MLCCRTDTDGALGFPLPSAQGVSLVAPNVMWDAGYLAVVTNYTYTPPSLKAPKFNIKL